MFATGAGLSDRHTNTCVVDVVPKLHIFYYFDAKLGCSCCGLLPFKRVEALKMSHILPNVMITGKFGYSEVLDFIKGRGEDNRWNYVMVVVLFCEETRPQFELVSVWFQQIS